jgi:hypothetical protein
MQSTGWQDYTKNFPCGSNVSPTTVQMAMDTTSASSGDSSDLTSGRGRRKHRPAVKGGYASPRRLTGARLNTLQNLLTNRRTTAPFRARLI